MAGNDALRFLRQRASLPADLLDPVYRRRLPPTQPGLPAPQSNAAIQHVAAQFLLRDELEVRRRRIDPYGRTSEQQELPPMAPPTTEAPYTNSPFNGRNVKSNGLVLPDNNKRRYLLIQNFGTLIVLVGFGQEPNDTNGVRLAPAISNIGGSYELGEHVPNNAVYLRTFGGGVAQDCVVVEG